MITPNAADFVEQWLGRVTVLHDVENAEIRHHVGVDQRRKGKADQPLLGYGGGGGQRHPPAIAPGGTNQRQGGLDQGHRERQDQRVMTKFGKHGIGWTSGPGTGWGAGPDGRANSVSGL